MKKVASYLKGLAETRARVAADVQRLGRLERELAEQLQNVVQALGMVGVFQDVFAAGPPPLDSDLEPSESGAARQRARRKLGARGAAGRHAGVSCKAMNLRDEISTLHDFIDFA